MSKAQTSGGENDREARPSMKRSAIEHEGCTGSFAAPSDGGLVGLCDDARIAADGGLVVLCDGARVAAA